MNPFEFVIVIVIVGVIGSVLTNLIKSREHRRDNDQESLREADELRDHIVDLEDRIKVLERIITNPNSKDDLRRQFRDLER